MKTIKILFFGDLVGSPGCAIFQKHVANLRKKYSIDSVIVNGENSSRGRGVTSRIMQFFKHHLVDVVTSGNHIWANKEIYSYLATNTDLLRPANFPAECPGTGVTTFTVKNTTIGVINLQGRVFMRDNLACPFKTVDSILTYLHSKTRIILLDFHAEATSEKLGLAYYLDGKISVQVGTHTHVQTADERILPGGTAYITDVGMAGSYNSMIGMKKEPIIKNFITQMPVRFEVATHPPYILCGVIIEIEITTGKAVSITRIQIIDDDIAIDT